MVNNIIKIILLDVYIYYLIFFIKVIKNFRIINYLYLYIYIYNSKKK